MSTSRYRNVHVVVNPAAGQPEPILNVLNDVFNRHGVKWDVSLSHKFGDATRLAQEAVTAGYDLVAGYGGDGTQMEIANGVKGSRIPMAILPGGTGNAMAFDLKVPRDLRQAVELICTSQKSRQVDLGQIGDRFFMLRTYTGVDAEKAASREEKDKYGNLAYVTASIRVAHSMQDVPFVLTVDGERVETSAFVCMIFNAGSWGGIDIPDLPNVDSSDGFLDVVMISKSVRSLLSFASYQLDLGFGKTNALFLRGKEIQVESATPQSVWIDGEAYGETPFTAVVIPEALQIVVPE